MKINKKIYLSTIALASFAVLITITPAFAETTNQSAMGTKTDRVHNGQVGNKENMRPGISGTVSAIDGNIITITSKKGPETSTTTTTYTIDATNAKIIKSNVVGTISSIALGDILMAQGTVTGTNVIATTIRDGLMAPGQNKADKNNGQEVSGIVGNGQPVIAGTITVISGSTLTITNKSNVSYSIDVSSAKITQGQKTILVSNMAVGDTIIVQGTINGNAVTASSVIDQAKTTTGTTEQRKGFFGQIGSFFKSLFGI